ncbi:MAG: hypothetical protein ACRBK7_08245 [Acidimicrobiales bacterium]
MAPQYNKSARRLARVSAFAFSSLFVTFLVVSTSRGAFSDTTDNTANSVSAGTVTLVDDDTGAVLFNVSGMAPTDSVSHCIVVTYNGDLTPGSAVQLYRSAAITGTGLDQYLDLVVEVGTGGTYSDCTGFTPSVTLSTGSTLQSFATTHQAYASALGTGWLPTGAGQARTFRFTLTLQDNNAAQGLNTTFGFSWEARS